MAAKKPESKPDFSAPRYWPTWFGIGLLWFSAQLPLPVQLALGRGLGWTMYAFGRQRRDVTEANLRLCFPEMEPLERRRLVRKTFYSNAIGLIETATAWFRGAEHLRQRVRFTGHEHLEDALKHGNGVILLGAHFTTLDLGGALLALFADYDFMYRQHKNPLFDHFMCKGRDPLCGNMFERKDMPGVLNALKNNRVLWYAPDQDYGPKHSVFAPFFGVPAATITGTARFASQCKAQIVPFSHFRRDDGRGYEIRLFPALQDFPVGDDVADATRVNQWIESEILKHPDQYMWLHRRFKTRPAGELRPYRYRIVKKIRSDRYHAYRKTPGRVLEGSRETPKVIFSEDGRILKFFRPRKQISTSRIFPLAERFVRNSIGLRALGIPAAGCDRVYRCKSDEVDIISYPALDGRDIRELLAEGDEGVLARIPGLMHALHEQGVMFTAIHLGNILVLDKDQELALIDIADLHLKGRPLHVFERARNLLHLINNKDDRDIYRAYGTDRFLDEYLQIAGISGRSAKILSAWYYQFLSD